MSLVGKVWARWGFCARMGKMNALQKCPECGTVWLEGRTCHDEFYQMLFWEAEYPHLGEVHHLAVLCFHLQHPSSYSPKGLAYARQLLEEFVERGTSPAVIRQRSRSQVDSGNRSWKIKESADAFGDYGRPIPWAMTAVDVTAAGAQNYCAQVTAWAQSVYEALKTG